MTNTHWLAIGLGFLGTLLLTPAMGWVARRVGAIDDPAEAPQRKRHTRPTPLLGGLSIIVVVNILWLWLAPRGHGLTDVSTHTLIGLAIASLIIAIGGVLDDRWRLPASRQLLWAIAGVIAALAAGVGITFITNPFGGVLHLDQVQWTLFTWQAIPYHLTLWADLFTFIWLLGSMYTTKILDGLDGLVSGFGVIGAIVVFLLTLRPEVNQPGVAIMALSLAGACLGFLIWNWHPAKIFLGESGSLFIGFALGVLSVVSGGKIATALLILGLPILDLLWVILQRLKRGASPLRTADRTHLHFRLLDVGLSVRQTVGLLYAVTAVFGLSTLFVSGKMKVLVLGLLFVVMLLLVTIISRRAAGPPTPQPPPHEN